jgi:hypothetical protein
MKIYRLLQAQRGHKTTYNSTGTFNNVQNCALHPLAKMVRDGFYIFVLFYGVPMSHSPKTPGVKHKNHSLTTETTT